MEVIECDWTALGLATKKEKKSLGQEGACILQGFHERRDLWLLSYVFGVSFPMSLREQPYVTRQVKEFASKMYFEECVSRVTGHIY